MKGPLRRSYSTRCRLHPPGTDSGAQSFRLGTLEHLKEVVGYARRVQCIQERCSTAYESDAKRRRTMADVELAELREEEKKLQLDERRQSLDERRQSLHERRLPLEEYRERIGLQVEQHRAGLL